MQGFNLIFKKSNRYWALLIITTILCYGFALTNISIGVDDEGAGHIWNGGPGLINNGRFGVLLLSKVFNIMSPLPFWRDFLAVLVLIGAACIFAEFFNLCTQNALSENAKIICACLFVSVPVLAFAFVYLLYVIEFALTLLFAGLALLFFYNGFLERKLRYFIFAVLLLAFGASFYEHCINHFITGALCGSLILLVCGNHMKLKRFAWWIILILACSIIAVLITFSIAAVIRNVVFGARLSFGGYALSALNINLSQAFFADIGLRIKNLLNGSIYFKWYAMLSLLMLIICVVQTIKRKNLLIILNMLLIILSTWMMEFLQGSGGVPPRTMVVYAVYFGFSGLYIYQVFCKSKMRYAVIFLTFLIVFYNSKEMNTVFYTDYQRYKLDQARAVQIDNEITAAAGEESDKPVVFIGRAPEYDLEYQYNGEVVGKSAFTWDGYFGIIDNPRLRGFMSMEGRNYEYADETQIENAKQTAYFMPDWPAEGSVEDNGESIVVRLSSPLYAFFANNEINELLSNAENLQCPVLTEGWHVENQAVSLTGEIADNFDNDENLKVHILIKGCNGGYLIPTIINKTDNKTEFFGWNVPAADISPDVYQTYIALEKDSKLFVIETDVLLLLE